ncbi:uncharacterized protein [Ptychodera flava]|uniref:uncharacterized protein isoform X1 n=2 Tax=Ptychodera flava TaxID=63121 RepID=UPI00396A6FBD
MEIGKFKVYDWSIAGTETCIVVFIEGLKIAFDIGYSTSQSVRCDHVFVSHGHMDHVSGLLQHAAKRRLVSMKSAAYYVPPMLKPSLLSAAQLFASMDGKDNLTKVNIQEAQPGDNIKLPQGYFVTPFKTVHVVPSQGYILWKQKSKLRHKFKGQASSDIAKLKQSGVEVTESQDIPEIAFTGDTTFEYFHLEENEAIRRVNLLIMEVTYLDDETTLDKARARGHIHLNELVENEELFCDVQSILLMHFSFKYSASQIEELVKSKLPESLLGKVHLGLTAHNNYALKHSD